MRRKGRGVTIDEVATLAGVSPMTVSRVMNNQGKVRDTTRERVMQAVRELDYTPNLAASSLAAAQHTRIALVYNNPSGAYLREMLVGLLVGAALGGALDIGGGVQVCVATLVDLRTGQVVWYNLLANQSGDLRDKEGANKTVQRMLQKLPLE